MKHNKRKKRTTNRNNTTRNIKKQQKGKAQPQKLKNKQMKHNNEK